MDTNKATFRWIDPFSGEIAERDWALPSFDAAGVAQAMGEIDTMEAGLPPGEGAGFDPIAFHVEQGGGKAAFVLQTRGLPHGSQLLLVGEVCRNPGPTGD